MIKKEFPALQEHYYEQRLENGLLLRVIPKPGFAKHYAFVAADFGSMDMNFSLDGKRFETPAGVAHYLEHKMFDMPDGNAMEAFARFGGSNNAFTNYTMTAYYVECTEQFEENLETLLKMVTTPCFTDESVEKERGIIAQEIKMYEDSADSACFENLLAAMYQNHPARIPIAGSVESIGKITAQTLHDCHRAFYDPSNMILCVMGDVEPERVLELARAFTPASCGVTPVRDYGPTEPMQVLHSEIRRKMEVSMPSFVIGFKCPPGKTGEQIARQELIGELAAELLAGESSELFLRMYEQGIIDSDFSIGFEHMKGLSLLEAAGDSDTPQAVLDALLERAEQIFRQGVDRQHFERLLRSMLGRRTRELDSFESTCYRMCESYFDGVEYLDYPNVFQSVTPEDVEHFLHENITKARAVLSVIEPAKEERR